MSQEESAPRVETSEEGGQALAAAVENVEESGQPSAATVENVEEGKQSPAATVENVEEGKQSPAATVENLEEGKQSSPTTIENVEEGKQSSPTTIENVEEGGQSLTSSEDVIEPCGPSSGYQFIMALLSTPFLILGGIFLKFTADSKTRDDFFYNGLVSALCLFSFAMFIVYSCRHARLGFNPSLIWGATFGRHALSSSDRRRRTRSDDGRGSSSRQEDIESQAVGSGDSEPEAADPSSETSDEKEPILGTSPHKVLCRVKRVSEVASAISKIALETVSEKGESLESSTSGDDQKPADETAEKTDSEPEIMSSGELRRRKLNNPEGNKVESSSNSSDEDSIKKE